MQPDILELLKKHESTCSVINELQILAAQTASNSLSTYKQALAGCSLQAAQNKLFKLSQQIQASLEKTASDAHAEIDAELAATHTHSPNRLTMPGMKLRPTPNSKAAAALDLVLKYHQTSPQAPALRIPTIKKLFLRLSSLSKKLSFVLIMRFVAKKLIEKYKQERKKHKLKLEKRKQDKLKLDKLKREKLKLRPTAQQILREEVNKYILREEALLLQSAYYAKLKLQNPGPKPSIKTNLAHSEQQHALNVQMYNQAQYTLQQTSNSQQYNAEQQRLLAKAQQELHQQLNTVEQEKYKRLHKERKLFEQFLATLIEDAVKKSAELRHKEELAQKEKLAKHKRRQQQALGYAQHWLTEVLVQREQANLEYPGFELLPALKPTSISKTNP